MNLKKSLRTLLAACAISVLCVIVVFSWSFDADASEQLIVPAESWVKVGTTPNFVIQSLCNRVIFIQPSATRPPATDIGINAFQIDILEVWDQGIPTNQPWWARAQGDSCHTVVQNY